MEISSSARAVIIAVFAIYTLVLFGYSLYSRKAMKEGKGDYMAKYYTGGRSGGVLMTAMMVSAGVAGAGVFMGVPGYTYTFGAVWMVCCFWSMCSNFMVLGLVGKRVGIVSRRINAQTFTELLMNRYNNSKLVGVLSSLVILFFLGAFAVSTITGGGRIFQLLTGQDYRIGLAIFTVLVIIAAVTGGIKGVATAIVIQGIIMTLSVIALFTMGVTSTGLGYTEVIQKLVVSNPEWFQPVWKPQMVFSFAFLWGVTTFTMPHVTMTALTYKDSKTLHSAIKIGTVVVAIWLLGLNGLCFIVKYTFPEGALATADLGIPALAVSVMPSWAAGLVLAGVCGAVQSSVGGMVVSLAGTVVKDLYKNIIRPDASEEKLKKYNIIITIVIALIVFLFACNPPALLASLITYATGGMTVAFFHTFLLGFFWKGANEQGAVAGIVSGIALYLLIDSGILPISLGMNACVMATFLSTIIMIVVCKLTPKTPYGIIATWFGKDYPTQNA
jgi:sodium/pantothenate symporter